jgi:hypothetical protein
MQVVSMMKMRLNISGHCGQNSCSGRDISAREDLDQKDSIISFYMFKFQYEENQAILCGTGIMSSTNGKAEENNSEAKLAESGNSMDKERTSMPEKDKTIDCLVYMSSIVLKATNLYVILELVPQRHCKCTEELPKLQIDVNSHCTS